MPRKLFRGAMGESASIRPDAQRRTRAAPRQKGRSSAVAALIYGKHGEPGFPAAGMDPLRPRSFPAVIKDGGRRSIRSTAVFGIRGNMKRPEVAYGHHFGDGSRKRFCQRPPEMRLAAEEKETIKACRLRYSGSSGGGGAARQSRGLGPTSCCRSAGLSVFNEWRSPGAFRGRQRAEALSKEVSIQRQTRVRPRIADAPRNISLCPPRCRISCGRNTRTFGSIYTLPERQRSSSTNACRAWRSQN